MLPPPAVGVLLPAAGTDPRVCSYVSFTMAMVRPMGLGRSKAWLGGTPRPRRQPQGLSAITYLSTYQVPMGMPKGMDSNGTLARKPELSMYNYNVPPPLDLRCHPTRIQEHDAFIQCHLHQLSALT